MPSYASGAAGSLPAALSVPMSPPAQKDLPTARTTSAPISGFASTSSNVAISSSAIEGVNALRRSGAFSVTIATAPSTSSSTSPEPATSPPLSQEAGATAGEHPHASQHDGNVGPPSAPGRRPAVRTTASSPGLLCLGQQLWKANQLEKAPR